MTAYEWKPLQCLQTDSDCSFALVMLNQQTPCCKKFLKCLWKKASFKMTVDGGTNHLYNTFVNDRELYVPDLITGDFDSIRCKVKKYYEEKGVEVIKTPDQNYTDFTKALRIISEKIKEKQIKEIVVLGAYGGRFDHLFANVNSLFEARTFCDAHIMLFSEDTVAFLLKPGQHRIHVDPKTCGKWCGLIPVGEPCNSVTTQGLKWNLENQRLKFGDLISTSNTLESEKTNIVTIETDNPLLLTIGIKSTEISNGLITTENVLKMDDIETEEDILKLAWLCRVDDYDSSYPEDSYYFRPPISIDCQLDLPIDRYCKKQRRALQTEIFAGFENNVYISFSDSEFESNLPHRLCVKSKEKSGDQILTPYKILQDMHDAIENCSIEKVLEDGGDRTFIEDVEVMKLKNGDITIEIECSS